MGSSLVWGDVRSFAVTEYDRSCDSGIFRSWWPKVMSPYIYGLQAWHLLHSVEWKLNTLKMEALSKGATRLTPDVEC